MKLLYSLVLLLLSINCILSFNRHQLPINHNSYRGCDRGRDSSVGSATRATTTAINEIPIAKSTSTKIRFIRTNETSAHKPPLLYVPGLDGVGNYSAENFANLTENFDVWRMIVSPDDRSSFVEISNLIVGQVNSFQQPAVVIGESFGGLMSLYVSLRTKNVQKLVLVNPATSYDRTIWPTAGPLIASLGSTVYPAVGIATLLATVVEREQFVRIGRQIVDKINSTESAVAEMNKLLASGNLITELLPPETLDWRLKQWLGVGAFVMKNKLKEVTTDTIILVGSDDRLIPSKDEGKRLKREIVNAQVELRTFNRRGHALLDDSFNLPKVLRTSKLFRSALGEEAVIVNEMPPPTAESIADADKYIENFKKIFSPVFISRSKTGKLTFGIKDIPVGTSGRPVLLVGNHQLFGADMAFLIREFLAERNTWIRGLAHPGIFDVESPLADDNTRDLFVKYGAVEVSPKSIFQLLKMNSTVLLFPGGVQEALHGSQDSYKLFWPEKTDFVRMAAIMDAIIVPYGAIGMADSVNFLFDPDEVINLPIIGNRVREANMNAIQARAGFNQSFVTPLFNPSVPARTYFLFQEPFDTRNLNVYDKKECKKVYQSIKFEVETALSALLEFRKSDPYKDVLPRLLYERVANKPAPTASLSKLPRLLQKRSQP